MSKRDTFVRNILAVTRARSLKNAMRGWEFQNVIRLTNRRRMATCELCGTSFLRGGVLRHKRTNAEITVGGTCLETIRLGHFGSSEKVRKKRKETRRELRQAYADWSFAVDPGAWITWTIRNAPRRYARWVGDLQCLGIVETAGPLKKLIDYHDRTRLFPRKALLPEWRTIASVTGEEIDSELTLKQARRLLRLLEQHSVDLVERQANRYRRREFLPRLKGDLGLKQAWRRAGSSAKRAVVALAKLSEEASKDNPICPAKVAFPWPAPKLPVLHPTFLWHRFFGLALVGEMDYDDTFGSRTCPFLWALDDYTTKPFELSYWRAVTPPSEQELERIEDQAFGVHQLCPELPDLVARG